MTDSFVHLHNHSTYSPLDGMIRIPELVDKVVRLGQRGVAITDHGLMSAAPVLYMEAKSRGIKPIIGQEFYIVPQANNHIDRTNYHLVLLALNEAGYRTLVELSSVANLKGNYYFKPRIDWEILRHYRKGLRNVAALTACMSGEIQSSFNDNNKDTEEVVDFYRKVFPNLYIELQHHEVITEDSSDLEFDKLQRSNHKRLLKLAKRYDIPTVITNDAHYLDEEDHFAHDVMLAVQTKGNLDDPKRFRFNGSGYHLTSGKELRKRFTAEEWRNSQVGIEDLFGKVDIDIPEFNKRTFHMPSYRKNPMQMVKDMCEEALERMKYGKQYGRKRSVYRARYEYEIKIIEEANFADEILIVMDYVNWARSKSIEVGGGRGSMVGVLVSYLLGITGVDPIKYGLSFERAINPARPSLPDFDVDFEDGRRKEVFEYLKERWGEENVIQVGTLGGMKPKGIFGAIMRSHGYSFEDRIKLTKNLPSTIEVSNLKKSAKVQDILEGELSPELEKVLEDHPEIADVAVRLQGIVAGHGAHAAGVVISDKRKPVSKYIPTMLIASSGVTVSQYDMYALGKIGFIKFDVLGLRTLSIIAQCKKFLGFDPFVNLDNEDEIYEDPATLAMLDKGDLLTIFELQGAASQQAVKILGVQNFNDVIALQALSRTGANQFIPDYKKGRDGSNAWRKRLAKIHSELPDILSRTYGAVVYQEQVMEISRRVAGFDWNLVDAIKDMIKHKSSKEAAELKIHFMQGCKDNGVKEKDANVTWSMIERACGYMFNLSHATAYAVICMQTAYMKCHYPREWFAAYLNHAPFEEYGDIVENALARGVRTYPPDVNKSGVGCVSFKSGIRFGLSLIKGVGQAASGAIVSESPYTDVGDFTTKLPKRRVNTGVVAILEKVGAFRSIGGLRKPNSDDELTKLGCYLYGHPLDPYAEFLAKIYGDPDNTRALREQKEGSVCVGGMISRVKEIVTKRGDKMGFVTLTYFGQQFELVVFPKMWNRRDFTKGHVIIVQGIKQLQRGGNVIVQGYAVLSVVDGKIAMNGVIQ